jgi:hypothetical protein
MAFMGDKRKSPTQCSGQRVGWLKVLYLRKGNQNNPNKYPEYLIGSSAIKLSYAQEISKHFAKNY